MSELKRAMPLDLGCMEAAHLTCYGLTTSRAQTEAAQAMIRALKAAHLAKTYVLTALDISNVQHLCIAQHLSVRGQPKALMYHDS